MVPPLTPWHHWMVDPLRVCSDVAGAPWHGTEYCFPSYKKLIFDGGTWWKMMIQHWSSGAIRGNPFSDKPTCIHIFLSNSDVGLQKGKHCLSDRCYQRNTPPWPQYVFQYSHHKQNHLQNFWLKYQPQDDPFKMIQDDSSIKNQKKHGDRVTIYPPVN